MGRITQALARSGARVVAVELDSAFAESLRKSVRGFPHVDVVEGDALQIPLPRAPFRAFGNVPFALTTAILRRLLDDPTTSLLGADLIVQYEAGRKRAAVWPSNVVSLGWQPWWGFHLARRLPSLAFEPPPQVDAGFLSISRRSRPLLPASRRDEYRKLVHSGFRQAGLPVHRSLRGRLPERAWKRMAHARGLPPGAKASDLDVFDWVALSLLVIDSNR
jgi:23S rRNA (adenine-N6)-dimethyltransferase